MINFLKDVVNLPMAFYNYNAKILVAAERVRKVPADVKTVRSPSPF